MKCLFKKEYDFDNVFLASPEYAGENKDYFMKYCKNIFPINILYSKDIPKLKLYYYFIHFEKCVRKITPRTGITAVALAASLGYKKIYLVGFDEYYENKINYAFSHHSLYNKMGRGSLLCP